VGRPNTVVAEVPYGAVRQANGEGHGAALGGPPADADPGPGLSSVDADAIDPRRRRFGWRR